MFAFTLVGILLTVSYCNRNYERQRLLRHNLSEHYNPGTASDSGLKQLKPPLQINAKRFIMALQGLEYKTQILTASVFWYFTWKDEIFRWDHYLEYKNISRLTVKASDVWVPEVYIVNDVRKMPIRNTGDNEEYVIVKSNGYMTWFPAKELQTSCAVDVSYISVRYTGMHNPNGGLVS
ncbi:Hypothetical predicted protein [Mytilus galloprovincialis]|uniref:Neurotransmitter-gated ion-channel ligand-binding domain-containing protein n=1 Tax=Mytilus galloprovincialis TaxID=29158 RepID=A0A8B6DHR4_MYTGA|nr:Hypothetical predicted protein [Mytilus galloprovincialis]